MRAFTALLSLPALALAASIARRAGSVPAGPWSAGVWRQPLNDDIFFVGDSINASGGKFYVNKNTSAYCPSGVENLDCSAYPGTKTVFRGGNDTMFLDAAVPGGQQVYVAADGSLSYTVPHSGALPEGASATGFQRERSESFGAPVTLSQAGKAWLMCPVSEGEPRERTYQIFVDHTDLEDCLYSGMRTYTDEGDAWEYV
ncbi:uncharacterized protein GGS25DRAFT_319008 [Hypoxylon fragiforme]|uniref:uncharacterized protein n=1 Tax=Hypoxylon fragiforme TaxID=63214 RepID=UPI0020C70BEB|nr:uncharacterized protein GGS25DRAFT_319008 [Hypoxylon fragiforme]KAI2607104.1 hypothetical protein GGS25DRAFT_319008 [Hypoxylon fragiforme]